MHIVRNERLAAGMDLDSNELPLRGLLGGQFFTADHVKLWQTFLGKSPHDRSSDIPVFVPKHIANTRDLSPRASLDAWLSVRLADGGWPQK
jgi:hypothetical protein